jgi:hypothetical protein
VDAMKRLATTSTVVAQRPHNPNAVNAAGEWRPAMDHAGIDVHKKESKVCILTPTGEVTEVRIARTRERFREVMGDRTRRTRHNAPASSCRCWRRSRSSSGSRPGSSHPARRTGRTRSTAPERARARSRPERSRVHRGGQARPGGALRVKRVHEGATWPRVARDRWNVRDVSKGSCYDLH